VFSEPKIHQDILAPVYSTPGSGRTQVSPLDRAEKVPPGEIHCENHRRSSRSKPSSVRESAPAILEAETELAAQWRLTALPRKRKNIDNDEFEVIEDGLGPLQTPGIQ
jgi:hypothetical protein